MSYLKCHLTYTDGLMRMIPVLMSEMEVPVTFTSIMPSKGHNTVKKRNLII